MTSNERALNLLENSWLEFTTLKDTKFYYNYLSDETTIHIPSIPEFNFSEKNEAEKRKSRLKDLLISQDNILFKTVSKLIGTGKVEGASGNIVNVANLVIQAIAKKEPFIRETLDDLPNLQERHQTKTKQKIPEFKLISLPDIKTTKKDIPKFSKLSYSYKPQDRFSSSGALTTKSKSSKAFGYNDRWKLSNLSPRIPIFHTLRD